jgi:hypothetical protein
MTLNGVPDDHKGIYYRDSGKARRRSGALRDAVGPGPAVAALQHARKGLTLPARLASEADHSLYAEDGCRADAASPSAGGLSGGGIVVDDDIDAYLKYACEPFIEPSPSIKLFSCLTYMVLRDINPGRPDALRKQTGLRKRFSGFQCVVVPICVKSVHSASDVRLARNARCS